MKWIFKLTIAALLLWCLAVGSCAWNRRVECGSFTWTQMPLFPLYGNGSVDIVSWNGHLAFLVLSPDESEPELEVGEGYLLMHCLAKHKMWSEGYVYYVHEDRYSLYRPYRWGNEPEVFALSAYEGAPNFLSMREMPEKRERLLNAIRALEPMPAKKIP